MLALLVLALAPGTWIRSSGEVSRDDRLSFTKLDAETPEDWPQGLTLEAAWELESRHSRFFGFSALLLDPEGGFRAYNDGGDEARFPRPASGARVKINALPFTREISVYPDVEAASFDPVSGTRWISYEYHNAIRRIDAEGGSKLVKPSEMAHWSGNGGGEAMVRLAGGRFIILAERRPQGLLWSSDPVDGARASPFRFTSPEGFWPTDMAQLPDGRVLILLRAVRFAFPPFASMVVIADPASIKANGEWSYEELFTLDEPSLNDNYEGIAIEPAGDGAATIWLISDDNISVLQRTLLLKIDWKYSAHRQTAREADASGPLTSG